MVLAGIGMSLCHRFMHTRRARWRVIVPVGNRFFVVGDLRTVFCDLSLMHEEMRFDPFKNGKGAHMFRRPLEVILLVTQVFLVSSNFIFIHHQTPIFVVLFATSKSMAMVTTGRTKPIVLAPHVRLSNFSSEALTRTILLALTQQKTASSHLSICPNRVWEADAVHPFQNISRY